MTTPLKDLLAKATPGPWEAIKGVVETDEHRCGVTAVRGDRSYLVATIENGAPGDFCDTEYVNAALIALTPTLAALVLEAREALEVMTYFTARTIECAGLTDTNGLVAAARTTLAKLEAL